VAVCAYVHVIRLCRSAASGFGKSSRSACRLRRFDRPAAVATACLLLGTTARPCAKYMRVAVVAMLVGGILAFPYPYNAIDPSSLSWRDVENRLCSVSAKAPVNHWLTCSSEPPSPSSTSLVEHDCDKSCALLQSIHGDGSCTCTAVPCKPISLPYFDGLGHSLMLLLQAMFNGLVLLRTVSSFAPAFPDAASGMGLYVDADGSNTGSLYCHQRMALPCGEDVHCFASTYTSGTDLLRRHYDCFRGPSFNTWFNLTPLGSPLHASSAARANGDGQTVTRMDTAAMSSRAMPSKMGAAVESHGRCTEVRHGGASRREESQQAAHGAAGGRSLNISTEAAQARGWQVVLEHAQGGYWNPPGGQHLQRIVSKTDAHPTAGAPARPHCRYELRNARVAHVAIHLRMVCLTFDFKPAPRDLCMGTRMWMECETSSKRVAFELWRRVCAGRRARR
jgi:hypothetical protein